MHLHHFRCFEEHVRMLWQSLSTLCKAPGGAGSIWKYLEAVVRATRVSGRFAYSFRTELHFPDVVPRSNLLCPQSSTFCVDPAPACDASSSSSAHTSSPFAPSYPLTSLVARSNLSSSVTGRHRQLAVGMASHTSRSLPSSS